MEALFGHPILQSLLAGILSWISVSLGASAIFLRREFSRLSMDCMLGAAGGMMLGAAFLGLLEPAAAMASHMGRWNFVPLVCGLMAGAAFLMGLDHLLPHLHIRQKQQEGLSTSWRRSVLLVTAMALTLGILLGIVVAVIRTAHDQQRTGHKNPILGLFNGICKVYVTVIRGTPMMVQLLIMSMVIFSNSRNFTMVGALTLGINSGAYVSEIIRGGLMAVDPGQMEAGRSLGLNYMTTMVVIIIPQAIRAVLPALGNEFIVLLKDTSLITTIGGKELLYAAQGIMNRTYEAMFPLLGVALIYLILVMLFTWLLSKFERRLAQSDR